eukprot:1151186-Pelagomonas_calceolata.AAC.13
MHEGGADHWLCSVLVQWACAMMMHEGKADHWLCSVLVQRACAVTMHEGKADHWLCSVLDQWARALLLGGVDHLFWWQRWISWLTCLDGRRQRPLACRAVAGRCEYLGSGSGGGQALAQVYRGCDTHTRTRACTSVCPNKALAFMQLNKGGIGSDADRNVVPQSASMGVLPKAAAACQAPVSFFVDVAVCCICQAPVSFFVGIVACCICQAPVSLSNGRCGLLHMPGPCVMLFMDVVVCCICQAPGPTEPCHVRQANPDCPVAGTRH